MLVLSLLVVSRGLAASAPPHSNIIVDPAKAQSEPLRAAPPSAPAPSMDPIVATELPDTHFQPSLRDTMTPAGLRRLVALHAAHPEPLRPAVECMARTVFREAANQALSGQLAVAQVILNRTRSGAFPKSVCAVVGQHGQFAQGPVGVSSTSSKPWDAAVAIATIAQQEEVPQIAPGALFFHTTAVRPAWSGEHERVAQIGDHIFYR